MRNGDYIVAIDLGTHTVASVVGSADPDGKIRIIDYELIPVQGMVRGEIKNIEQVSQAIKQTIDAIESRQQIRITEAFTGISGRHIRSVKYPYYVFVGRDGEIREEDVRKLHESMSNVQAPDGETIIQIIPQNYVVDGEETDSPVGTFGNKLEATFNFLLGDTNAVSRVKRALTRVQVKQGGIFLNAVAAAEAVVSPDEKEEGVAVVDLGAAMTDVVVYYKNVIRHVGIVSMGGNSINKDIRSYGILERHVENLKVKYGFAMREKVTSDKLITTPGLNSRIPKEISALNLAAIIEARMLDIIDFVIEELKKSGYADRLGAGVILTGGGAQLKELDSLFKTYTGLDVRIALPYARLTEDSLIMAENPALSSAIGLLIKGVDSAKEPYAPRTQRPMMPPAAAVRPPVVPQEEEEVPQSEPTARRTINEMYQEQPGDEPTTGGAAYGDDFDDSEEDRPRSGKRGGGLFGKLRRKMESMFDVIEDNEI